MKIAVVLRVLSVFLVIISIFLLTPVAVALYYGEHELIRHFLMPVGANILIAVVLFWGLRRWGGLSLSIRVGFLFVTLAWLSASASGALPFYLSGSIPSYADAFFETMSGFTTTGASILTEIESLPYSILFWRSLTHWLGGMGIITLALAIFPAMGVSGYGMYRGEVPGYTAGGKNWVHVRDVAVAMANALTMGEPGECYLWKTCYPSFTSTSLTSPSGLTSIS